MEEEKEMESVKMLNNGVKKGGNGEGGHGKSGESLTKRND